MTTLDLIAFAPTTPATAPDCPLLIERARRNFTFEAEIPCSFDLNWPEENAFGEMRGLGAFRIECARPARLRWTVEADTITTVRPAGDSAVTVSVFAAGGEQPRISVQALVCPDGKSDPLLAAMLGDHPLHWMHSLIHGIGSSAWATFAQEARVWPPQLDRILGLWRELSTGAESALWRCAGDGKALDAILDWALRLKEGMSASDIDAAVRVCLAADPAWAASPEAEWLEACSGFPLAMLTAPVPADRLQAASKIVIELIKSGLNAQRLNSVREMADAGLGRERLSPGSVRTRHQKRLHRRVLERLSHAIHSEAQFSLESAATESLGLLIAGSGNSWPLVEATFDLASPGAAQAFQSALAKDLAAFLTSSDGVRAEPALLTLCSARPIALHLSLPPLPLRRTCGVLEGLSEPEVLSTPGGRIEVRAIARRAARLHIGEESLVRRLAVAPICAASREPGNGRAEFGCEDSSLLSSATPSVFLHRLLDRYELPLPHGNGQARLRISVPSAWTEVWHELPHSRDESFQRVFSSIAETIQTTVRRWLPHLALKDAMQYSEPLTTAPLLVYAASQPYRGSGKRRFTHESLTAPGFQLAFNSASQELPGILREIHSSLSALSHRSTRSYDPARAQTLLGTVFRQRRYFSSLLAIDALLVEEVLHLADSAAELSSLADTPKLATKLLFKSIDSAQSGLCRRFRRMYDARSFDLLLSVVWVEAAAACRAMGAHAEVAAVLTLEHAIGCEHFHNAAALGRN